MGAPSDDFLPLARLSPKRPSKQGEALGSGLKNSGSHLSLFSESWCFYTFGLFVDCVVSTPFPKGEGGLKAPLGSKKGFLSLFFSFD